MIRPYHILLEINHAPDTKQTRVVKKTVPTESFFNFFSPPQAPTDEDDDDTASDIEERLELDYQLGEDIKEKLIPRAVDWFTGEALQFEEMEDDDDMEEHDFEDDDDEEDDDLSEDHDDEDESEEDVCSCVSPFLKSTSNILRMTMPSQSKRLPSASRAK